MNESIIALIEQSKALESQGDMAQAWKCLRQAQELALNEKDAHTQAQVLLQMAHLEYFLSHYLQASQYAQEALELANPETPEVVRAWLILGNCTSLNDNVEAEACYRKAADLARQFGTVDQRVSCLHNLGNGIYLQRGQFDLALSHEMEAYRLSKQHGLKHRLYLHYITICRVYLRTGQLAAAKELIAEWLAQDVVSEGDFGYRCMLQAELALAEGEFQAAAGLYQQALARAEMIGEAPWLLEIYHGNSNCCRLSGDRAGAMNWANQAIKFAEDSGGKENIDEALLVRARATWEQDGGDPAIADLRTALELFGRWGNTYGQARAALLLAGLLHQLGRPDAEAAFVDAGQRLLRGGYIFLLDMERWLAYPLVAAYLSGHSQEVALLAEQLLQKLQSFPPAPLYITTLGGLQVRSGARLVDRKILRQRSADALLVLLLIQRSHSLTSDEAAEALCPDKTPEAGRDFVHHATSALRRALEPELPDRRFPSRYLEAESERLTLRLPPHSTLDFETFQTLYRQKNYALAAQHYTGEFLPEFRYQDWAIEHRLHLQEQYSACLLSLARQELERQQTDAALEHALCLVRLDPLHEEAVWIAMQAYQKQGEIAAARKIYHRLEKMMRQDLGLAPEASLQELYRQMSKTPRKTTG